MFVSNMKDKTDLAASETKTLAADRKTMSVRSADESGDQRAAASLDSALYADVVSKYTELKKEADENIVKALDALSGVEKCTRVYKAVCLLNGDETVTSERVFKPRELQVKTRNKTDEDHGKYSAACVRVGGKYVVAMRRGTPSPPNLDNKLILDQPTDKVFPEAPRDSFVLDDTYPLVAFEEHKGTTYAVFLTGVEIKSAPLDKPTVFDENRGHAAMFVTGHRFAHIPVLCLFDTAEGVASMKLTTQEAIVPAAQPMDIHEFNYFSDMLKTEMEKRQEADNADSIDQRIDVYELRHKEEEGGGGPRYVFALSATQTNCFENSWCNKGGVRSFIKSGGFSGKARDMNDTCCFADCIDVSVVSGECCLTIEPGRRLFESNPNPYTKTEEQQPSTSKMDDEDSDSSDASFKKREVHVSKKDIVKFKLSSPQKESDVMERLVTWHDTVKKETGERQRWWGCKLSPPLLMEDLENEEERVQEHNELKAAVRSAHLFTNLTAESDVREIVRSVVSGVFEDNSTVKRKFCTKNSLSNVEKAMQEIENGKRHFSDIWTDESVRVAQGLLIDEAAASSLAQVIADHISKSGVLVANEKSTGMRKRLTGSHPVSFSNMKSASERDIDATLKDWIKSKMTAPSTSIFVPGKRKAAPGGERSAKSRKSDEPSSADATTPPPPPEFVSVIPPSFVKTARLNTDEFAEGVADILGRNLCEMSSAPYVFERMCYAVNALKVDLVVGGPGHRFTVLEDVEERLCASPRASDVMEAHLEAAKEEVKKKRDDVSVLSYEADKLAPLFASNENRREPSLSVIYESAESWALAAKNGGHQTQVMVAATALRRIYEEHHAYNNLACVLIFNKIKQELEGNTHDPALAAAFNWYCAVVARNRICDMFPNLPSHVDETTTTAMFYSLLDKLSNDKLSIAVLAAKIVESVRWVLNTGIPSGFLKGEYDQTTTDNQKLAPSQTLDETSKYVVPALKIGTCALYRATRIGPHVDGPFFISANFNSLGLYSVDTAMLLVNRVTGKGLLVASPQNSNGDEQHARMLKVTRGMIAHPSLASTRAHALPSFFLSPSHPSGVPRKSKLFDRRSFQANNIPPTRRPAAACGKKPWSGEAFDESADMWRAGFVLPKKACEAILRNSAKNILVEASPGKKSKMTPSIADECISCPLKHVEKIVRTVALFTDQDLGKTAKNLAACAPSEVEFRAVVESDSEQAPLVSCSMVQDDTHRFESDMYGLVFRSYAYKNCKVTDAVCGGNEDQAKKRTPASRKIVDASFVCNVINSTNKNVSILRKLVNKHSSCVTSYRKKMK